MADTKYAQYVYINQNCRCTPPSHGPCHPYGHRCPPRMIKGVLSEVNTANPIFYVKYKMDGSEETRFHVNLIDQLDRVFRYDGMRFLSEDQKRYFDQFFEQAGLATDKIKAKIPSPFNNMDESFIQLDEFLGSYLGVDHGPYER